MGGRRRETALRETARRKGRHNSPAHTQVQNLPTSFLLEPAGWMVEVMVRTEA